MKLYHCMCTANRSNMHDRKHAECDHKNIMHLWYFMKVKIIRLKPMKKTLLETEVRTRSKQQPRAEEPQNFITVPLHRTQKIERLKQVNPGWSGSRQ